MLLHYLLGWWGGDVFKKHVRCEQLLWILGEQRHAQTQTIQQPFGAAAAASAPPSPGPPSPRRPLPPTSPGLSYLKPVGELRRTLRPDGGLLFLLSRSAMPLRAHSSAGSVLQEPVQTPERSGDAAILRCVQGLWGKTNTQLSYTWGKTVELI